MFSPKNNNFNVKCDIYLKLMNLMSTRDPFLKANENAYEAPISVSD